MEKVQALDISIPSGILINMRKRSEATRKIILVAAKDLFLSQGYVATTVEAIADRANITKRTIYGYYPDKRALFKGVIEQSVGDPWEFHIPLEAIGTVEGVRNALFAIGQGVNEIMTHPDYVQLLRVTITEIPMQPDLSILFERGVTRRAYRTTTGLLTFADTHGIVSLIDCEAAARQFVGGFVLQVFLDGLLNSKSDIPKMTKRDLSNYVDDFLGRVTRIST
jgi:TetR/AcrR family transcriptional regulator, mexJK operon transcriptional repressor